MKKLLTIISILLAVAVVAVVIKFSLREDSSTRDSVRQGSLRIDEGQAKNGLEDSAWEAGSFGGRERNDAVPNKAARSDIQNGDAYAFGIVLDVPASGDLGKVENFVGQLKDIIKGN